MNKHIFLFSIFFLQFLLVEAQSNCFTRFQDAGDNALKKRDFDDARNQFNAALECASLTADQRNAMAERLRKVNIEITREDREARQKAEKAKDDAEENARLLAAAKARTDTLFQLSKLNEKRATGNEIGFKAQLELRDGDRTAAFRLAEFVEKYTDPGNAKATETLLDATYYNNDPRNHDKLGWRIHTLVENSEIRFTNLVFSNDGERVGTVNEQNQIQIWDILTGKPIFNWAVNDPMAQCKFSPALDAVAVAASFGKFFVIDVATAVTRFDRDFEKAGIEKMQFSTDGRRIGLTLADQSVVVFDVLENRDILKIKGDTLRYGIHFSEDLQHLAVISKDEKVKIYHLPQGNSTPLEETGGYIFAATFSPDGKYFVCSTEDRDILLFSAATGALLGKFTTLRDAVVARLRGAEIREAPIFSTGSPYKLEFSSDGTLLTAFFADRTALTFSVSDGAGLYLKNSYQSSFLALFETRAGGEAVLFSDAERLEIWGHFDLETAAGTPQELLLNVEFDGKYQPPYLFSPNGQRFAWATENGGVSVSNFRQDVYTNLLLNKASSAKLLAFSPDSRMLALARENGALEIWDASGEGLSSVPTKLRGKVQEMKFSETGNLTGWLDETGHLTVSQNSDDSIRFQILVGLPASQIVASEDKPLLHIPVGQLNFNFSPDGRRVAVFGRSTTSLQRDTIHILSTADGQTENQVFSAGLQWASFGGGGRFLKVENQFSQWLFEASTGKQLPFIPADSSSNIKISENGEWVAFKTPEGIFVADGKTGRRVFAFKNDGSQSNVPKSGYSKNENPKQQSKQKTGNVIPPEEFLPIGFSSDGKKLLIQTGFENAQIISTETWKMLASINSFGNFQPRFAPGGRRIISLAYYLNIWDASTGRLLTGIYSSGAIPKISKNGKWLAVPQVNQVSIFDFSVLEERLSLRGHRERITEMAFSDDEKLLATASEDKTIKCWNLTTGREIFSVSASVAGVEKLEFSPDGQLLSAIYGDGTRSLWAISAQKILQLAQRSQPIAALSEDQIYRFNLEQAFLERKPEEALADMEPPIQLGFARYFSNQAGISLDPKVYQDLFGRANLFYKSAISNLDSEVALRELAVMLTNWSVKLRRDSLFSQSRQVAAQAVKIHKSIKTDDVEMLIERGFAEGLAGNFEAALRNFYEALNIYRQGYESLVSKKVDVLAEIGEDREKWTNFWPAYEAENSKISSIESNAVSTGPLFMTFALDPRLLFDQGEYEQATKNSVSELIYSLSSLHQNPTPLQANATAQSFGNLSWYYLFIKNGTQTARRFATAGLALDSTVLFIHANLGHAALLEGDFDAATKIYDRLQNEWFVGGDRYFRDAILEDLEKFAQAGKRTWSPLLGRAAQRILGERWDEIQEKRFELRKNAKDEEEIEEEKSKPKPEKQRKGRLKF